jgi:hypothetical protein
VVEGVAVAIEAVAVAIEAVYPLDTVLDGGARAFFDDEVKTFERPSSFQFEGNSLFFAGWPVVWPSAGRLLMTCELEFVRMRSELTGLPAKASWMSLSRCSRLESGRGAGVGGQEMG